MIQIENSHKMTQQLKRSQYTLRPHEVQLLINQVSEFRNRVMIKCLYFGGMRVFEVAKQKVQHFDFDRKVIHIEGKFGKSRDIPFIDGTFMSDVRNFIGKRQEGYLFTGKGGRKHLDKRTLQYMVKTEGIKAGIVNPNPTLKYLNCHLFRHSIARKLKSEGYRLEYIQHYLGHTSMETTADTYGTLGLEEMQKITVQKTGDRSLMSKPPRELIPQGEYIDVN